MFPLKQFFPHNNWDNEVQFLDNHFGNNRLSNILDSGASYSIGRTNGDHWYLYTTPSYIIYPEITVPENTNGVMDMTIEILMTELNKENLQRFYIDEEKKQGKLGGKLIEVDKFTLTNGLENNRC